MCLSTLYGVRDGKREKLGEYISNVSFRNGEFVFTDVMGNEFSVKGNIQSLDLVRNEIIIDVEQRKKMRYEMIREIYNKCSGNQMRDVFVSNPETDDPEQYVRDMLKGKEVTLGREDLPDGTVVIDADVSGLKQRFTFSPD
ncbi:MAG: CooT family nickel-binding protein [Oscillospiraceae bacterium]|jgi:predicted RNA-binding protein|nr:CooT family nickel-binding protein [Oscillospiraceae bacterium]